MQTIALVALVVLMQVIGSACLGADSGSDFLELDRFIGVLPTNLPPHQGMQWLVQWPSTNEIADTLATNDISAGLNPPPPKSLEEYGKPHELPVETPDEALYRAEQFLRVVFKSQWLPKDVRGCFLALRSRNLKDSRILCRYTTEGHRIQTVQKRTYMCVVIVPKDGSFVNVPPSEYAEQVLKTFFTRGDDMCAVSYRKEIHGTVTNAVPLMKKRRDDWWHSAAWLTDGKSLAVLLPNRISTQQRVWEAEEREPWF